MTAIALAGWAAALLMALRVVALSRRLDLVGDAEHELRGPLTAITLAAEAAARRPGALVAALDAELARVHTALADLGAARHGRRAGARPGRVELGVLVGRSGTAWLPAAERRGREVSVDWKAGEVAVRADRGRLAQAFGNLVANAVEHGGGPVELRGRRSGGKVLVEVADRGRGLGIAARAVEEAGGRLTVAQAAGAGTVFAVELPVADA